MLLYSTILDIKDTMTQDDFIQLVIQWNQSSPHADNIIPNVNWAGERNIRYGGEDLWLDIEEYRNKNIIAARFEKKGADGAIWNTDYIMNFDTMKMAIQLDRSYTEDAQMEDLQFSTPFFITMLIDGGYVADDHDLHVLRFPTLIREDNISLLADVINGVSSYSLPVVYVSKTQNNEEPVNLGLLSGRLKGAAHVFREEDVRLDGQIRIACNDKNAFHGCIGVYFPNGTHRFFMFRNYEGYDSVLLNKVTNSVFQYMIAQKLPILATWDGVNQSLLADKYASQKAERVKAEQAKLEAQREKQEAQREKQEAQEEVELFMDAFDDEKEKDRRHIEELSRANISLQMEIQGLRAKLNSSNDAIPALFLGTEEEFYQGEIREMILDAVAEGIKNTVQGSRRWDVLNDILQSNGYKKISESRERDVKNLFRGYKSMSGAMRQQLQDMGFEITEEGKHYRMTYYGDPRYHTTVAKSGSDVREGKNIAAEIIKSMM